MMPQYTRKGGMKTTQILNELYERREKTTLPGPQKMANNTPISCFDRRDKETQTLAIQNF